TTAVAPATHHSNSCSAAHPSTTRTTSTTKGDGMASSRTGLTPHLRFRRAVLTRDRRAGITQCPDCGTELDYNISRQPNSAEPDHVAPAAKARELGSTIAQLNNPNNGRTICRRCNQSRGAGKRVQVKKPTIQASAGW